MPLDNCILETNHVIFVVRQSEYCFKDDINSFFFFSFSLFTIRGAKVRSLWYLAHWLLGTGLSVAGIINTYIGLHAYHVKTSRSVRLWTALFTVEVVAIALVYLLQDRWDYMRKQGVILGEEQIAPTDHATPPRINNHKELGVMLQIVD